MSTEVEGGRRVQEARGAEELFHEEEEDIDAATISTLVRCLGDDIITCERNYFVTKGTDGIVVVSHSRRRGVTFVIINF